MELLELDAADLNGGVVLPVAADNLVLLDAAILENGELRMASLLDDLAGYLRLSRIRPRQKLVSIGGDADHVAKRDLAAHFSGQRLDLNRLPGRNPVLFPTTTNHGVHHPSNA